jgi:hypothetical protein
MTGIDIYFALFQYRCLLTSFFYMNVCNGLLSERTAKKQPSTVKSTDVSLIRRHAIKANGEIEVQLHSFLLSVDCVSNVTAHAQKPDFVFRRTGRVHLNRQGSQFSRIQAAEVCASAVMLDTPCSEVV